MLTTFQVIKDSGVSMQDQQRVNIEACDESTVKGAALLSALDPSDESPSSSLTFPTELKSCDLDIHRLFILFACALLMFAFEGSIIPAAFGQNRPGTTTQQPSTQNPSTAPPAGTTPQQGQPGAAPPGQEQLPPSSGTAPVRPGAEAQQSTQPQSNIDQQRQQTAPNTTGPQPVSPQVQPSQGTAPGGLPTTATPAGTAAPSNTGTPGATPGATGAAGVPATPGQSVGISSGIAPAQLPTEPPTIAPGYEAPTRPLPSAERVGIRTSEQLPLSLNDAIRLALENNNDIDTARIGVRLAEFDLTSARGIYDPTISSESFFERSTTPTSSTIGGGANGSVTQTDATGSARFGGFSPFGGGSYQFDFASTRLTTNNRFVALNPQFPTALTFTYTQPLLRGFRFDDNRRRIEIAKKNLSLTDSQFRQRAIETIAQVEAAYWDLAFALRNLQVQIDAVKQARVQVESNRRQVEQGILAPIDLVAADAQVTTFEQSVYTAQESVTRAENTLKTLLLPERGNQLWSRPLVPVTPVSLEPPRVPLEQALTAALANRPELAQLETNAEINQINTRFFRDRTRPQIDLVGTYNPVGLAGTFVPRDNSSLLGGGTADLRSRINELSILAGIAPLPIPPVNTGSAISEDLVGGYNRSLTNLLAQNYPTARIGVRISLPLKNRTAEANLGRSLAEATQIQNLRAQTEQIIEADVRNSMQAISSAEARLASAAASRASAEQQYASEQRQLQAGLSTVFLVLQRQTELLGARGRELQAQTDLNKAIAGLQRATGRTLDVNNVAIRSDTPLRQLEIAGLPVSAAGSAPVTPNASSKPDAPVSGNSSTSAPRGAATFLAKP